MRSESSLPFLIGGLLLALLMIALTFRANPPNVQSLNQRFAPQPMDPAAATSMPMPLPSLPHLNMPPEVQSQLQDLSNRLSGGQAIPALTPSADGGGVRITVNSLRRNGERVQVQGTVRNISSAELKIPADAFVFVDSSGVRYGTQGTSGATLKPGEEVPFDLGVPLPEGRGLSLSLNVPPAPAVQQVLFVEATQ